MNQPYSEKDLQQLFSGKKPVRYQAPWKWVLLFIALVFFFYFIFSYQAVVNKFSFWFAVNVQNQSYENPIIDQVVQKQESPEKLLSVVPVNSIYIDKINVKAPIIFDVANNETAVRKGLEDGVIQIKNTAHPGEQGNVFITGHSSNYFWDKGNYKQIFALLNNLDTNDNIVVNYKDALYIYRVTAKKIVSPTDIGVLKQTAKSELTLMTCYPVGTNLRRLVIRAEQVSPDPSQNLPRVSSPLDYLPDINL